MRARGQITINAPDKNYSVALIPSVTQIGCNSFGTPDPSSFEVKFQRITEGVVTEDRAYLAVYGFDSSGSWVLLSGSEVNTKRSEVIVTVNMKYLQYTVKAHTIPDPAFDSLALAVVSVNVVESGYSEVRGSMPRNCGEWNAETTYVYDKYFQDCVYILRDGLSYAYRVAVFGTQLTGVIPGVGVGWGLGNKEIFTAIDTALIDGADIARFLFKDGVMQSRDSTNGIANTIINGKTGEIITRKLTAINADITGKITATSGKIAAFDVIGGVLSSGGMRLTSGTLQFDDVDRYLSVGGLGSVAGVNVGIYSSIKNGGLRASAIYAKSAITPLTSGLPTLNPMAITCDGCMLIKGNGGYLMIDNGVKIKIAEGNGHWNALTGDLLVTKYGWLKVINGLIVRNW